MIRGEVRNNPAHLQHFGTFYSDVIDLVAENIVCRTLVSDTVPLPGQSEVHFLTVSKRFWSCGRKTSMLLPLQMVFKNVINVTVFKNFINVMYCILQQDWRLLKKR